MRTVRAKPPEVRLDDRHVVMERTIELLTPMFGGGVQVESDESHRQIKRPDAVTPLRTAAIRGQLRFWWRATHGCRHGSVESMRRRETEIWGAASVAGKVSVALRSGGLRTLDIKVFHMVPNAARTKFNGRALPGMDAVAYGAFPLKPADGKAAQLTPGTLTRVTREATLLIEIGRRDAHEAIIGEVRDALSAWLLFGGVGGRTRRGFGSVGGAVVEDPRGLLDVLQGSGPVLAGVPSLARARLALGRRFSGKDADLRALAHGLRTLKTFRQGEGVGRNRGQGKRPGRSRWPEAETIRGLTGCSDPAHRERLVDVDAFPRAAFGMPIITHFQSRTDPGDTTLTPVGAERLASPLHLGCYRASPTEIGTLALVLPDGVDHPAELVDQHHAEPVRTTLTAREANWLNSPLEGEPDPLAAFLRFYSTKS